MESLNRESLATLTPDPRAARADKFAGRSARVLQTHDNAPVPAAFRIAVRAQIVTTILDAPRIPVTAVSAHTFWSVTAVFRVRHVPRVKIATRTFASVPPLVLRRMIRLVTTATTARRTIVTSRPRLALTWQ